MLVLYSALPDVRGRVCEALLVQAYYYRGRLVSDASALFLRIRDGGWYRVVVEAGVVFCQRVDEPDSPGEFDRHHYAYRDLAAIHGYAGRRCLGITTVDLPSGGEVRVRFDGAPTVVFRAVEGESRVVLDAANS
jgi:hypothetical protein